MAIPAIHPGEHLAEELKELGMSAAELARQLGVPTNRVTEILNGRRAKGRKIHQPPADPEAFRASSRIAVFHPRIGCGCKCGCTLLNISNVSSISSGSSVRARLVVSCW